MILTSKCVPEKTSVYSARKIGDGGGSGAYAHSQFRPALQRGHVELDTEVYTYRRNSRCRHRKPSISRLLYGVHKVLTSMVIHIRNVYRYV